MRSTQTLLLLAVIIGVAGAGYYYVNRAGLAPAPQTLEATAPAQAPQASAPQAPASAPTSAPETTSDTPPPAPPITPATPDPNCTQFSLRGSEWVCTGNGG